VGEIVWLCKSDWDEQREKVTFILPTGIKKLPRPVVDYLEKLGFDFREWADGIAEADNNLFL
jgi:hypothetical protein